MATIFRLIRRSFSTSSISIPFGVSSTKKDLILESGRLARFADGCAICRLGDTSVMATTVSKTKASSSYGGFVPLMVDYRQKAAAAGRIPTNFLRRELGQSESEILTSRIIDRSLRVLFPKGYSYDTQIICNVLAVDSVHDADILAINAASTALTLSDIPWNGPVGAVRLALVDGRCVVNPTRHQLNRSTLNMVLTGASNRRIVMLEMSGQQVPVRDILSAINEGLDVIENIVESINSLRNNTHIARSKRTSTSTATGTILDANVTESIRVMSEMRLRSILDDATHDKISRDKAASQVRQSVLTELRSSFEDLDQLVLEEAFNNVYRQLFRGMIFEREKRCDGRGLTDLRPIECQIDLYAPLHGSALFQRGQTQVLCTVTFDSAESAFRSDPISVLMGSPREKQFLLHYEFPPYATNEIGQPGSRAAGRRELGHGALAEKALRPILPTSFPFTIRLTSEVLESNGSSSMASVCGGSLALMDAGVQILEPASGVAVGLVTKDVKDGELVPQDYLLLTDILGIEDYMGDMDLKIAGTRRGLTAVQLDLKIAGISTKILSEAIERATSANDRILNIMSSTIEKPRPNFKPNGPVVETLIVPPAKRQRLVGVGGLNLKRLEAEVGVRVTQLDDTSYSIFAPNSNAWNEAKERIEKCLQAEEDFKESNLEFGGIYEAKIVEIKDKGVMVQLYPEMTPVMIPNNQLDMRKINHPSALALSPGQRIMVKYFGRDSATGFMRLSRKILQQVGEHTGVKDFFDDSKYSSSKS